MIPSLSESCGGGAVTKTPPVLNSPSSDGAVTKTPPIPHFPCNPNDPKTRTAFEVLDKLLLHRIHSESPISSNSSCQSEKSSGSSSQESETPLTQVIEKHGW